MGSFATEFMVLSGVEDLISQKTDILVVPVFQTEIGGKKSTAKGKSAKQNAEGNGKAILWTPRLEALNDAMGGHLKESLEAEKFKADCGKKRMFRVRATDAVKARWVVFIGLGLPEKLGIPKATQAFISSLKDTYGFEKVQQAIVLLPEVTKKLSTVQAMQAIVFAAIKSTYKTEEAGEKKVHKLQNVTLLGPKGQPLSEEDVTAARVMAMAESFAKDLANKPANLKTAETLAQAARSLEKLPGITVNVMSDAQKIQKEMPAFWAVAQGAAQVDPPRFIKVTYTPTGAKKPKRHIALVGKGVIFDTGGVQVKTSNHMNDMKFDMTGAASVLATIKAASELRLKNVQVTAYVAATQNLLGSRAYLPDSIIESASGKTIEIRHTDAEGRVTLADAVYKASQDDPDEIVTVATLTGTAGLAVGHCIALMGSDDELVSRVGKAAKDVGEQVQALELLDEDFDNVKSDRDAADFCNTSKSRNRGHMSAGAFVISFAGDKPVAHLDIAGGDAKDGNATGIAVKGLIEFLRQS